MIDRILFHKLLITRFDDNDLRQLCFDANIDYENISGSTKDAKARGLIEYCQRRNKLEELLQICKKRDDIDWNSIHPIPQASPTLPVITRPMRTITTIAGTLRLILEEQVDDWLLRIENQSISEIRHIAINLSSPTTVLIAETSVTVPSLAARECSAGYSIGLDAVTFRIQARVSYYAPDPQRCSAILEAGDI